MGIKEVGSLRPRAAASPIEIRVLRMWNPPFRNNVTCFLFVDRNGDGIQANAHGKDQKYTESNLLPDSCYKIEGYACIHPEPYINTLSHPANLRIGAASTFTPILETEELPHQYFEFASHKRVERVSGNRKEVIDFIGLLLNMEDKISHTGIPYVSLMLKHDSNEIIEVALWEEISKAPSRFDRQAIEKSTHPAVIAVTAVKVKNFTNGQKLWSTRATYVYLNPNCLDTQILIDSFNKEAKQGGDTSEESAQNKIITVLAENKTTIADLLKKESEELKGRTFSLHGAVTKITTKNEWCHTLCLKCGTIIYPSEDQWFCTTDGMQNMARYIYRISGIISDDTGAVNATLFDEAVKGLVGITCEDMVTRYGYTDMESIPAPVLAITEKPKRFHVLAQKDTHSGNLRLTVNKVTDDNIPGPQTPAPTTIQSTSIMKTCQQFQESTSKTKRSLLFDEGTITGPSKKPK